MYDFDRQRRLGDKGEKFAKQNFGWKRNQARGRDLETKDGDIVELKTEFKADKTGNLFVERYSNYKLKTSGGPWKARQGKCDYYVFLVWDTKETFFFRPDQLIQFVKDNYTPADMRTVPNYGWTTAGIPVPIKKLETIRVYPRTPVPAPNNLDPDASK